MQRGTTIRVGISYITVVLALMASCVMAWSQVNIEKMRGPATPLGVGGSAKVDLSLRAGNAEVWQAAVGLRGDYGAESAWGLALVQGDFGFSGGERFSNQGLVHVRQAVRWRGGWWPEFFAQADYDRSRALEARALAGGGLRLRLYEGDRAFLRWGSGYMLEYERLDLAPAAGHSDRTTAHRWNNYVSLRWTLGAAGRFNCTAYAQPRFDALDDVRLLVDGSLGAELVTRLSLVNTLKLRYDSEPPDGIEALDLAFKSGIELSF
jgi:hypothetical protein